MTLYSYGASSSQSSSFLFAQITDILLDKLTLFSIDVGLVLNIGYKDDSFAKYLLEKKFVSSKDQLIEYDIPYNMLYNFEGNYKVISKNSLPFSRNTFDVIISNITLHNVNGLFSVLLNINNIMKNKGVFVASLFGSKTLYELRHSMIRAEMDTGVIPRIIPFIHVQDLIPLLQKSGYSDVVIDVNTIKMEYSSVYTLFKDLRKMNKKSVLYVRDKYPLTRVLIGKIIENYKKYFSVDKIYIPATFEIITLKASKV